MRRVRRKGGNKEKVFGCDLLEHLNASCQEIPQVLQCCSEFVEKNGVVDGIYRLSGVSSNIQKLRGEFESDGSPDLNKDVYLQDIHCVSSLCKAYFRELPNPLLTYQLYDKFAEAVAIQLEEERLVKIRDVLKELPAQHYRTLEFLMRHLVRMASYSAETNMHSRNLAIVWAPNLLRSKDIESTGFNGTAAFMEVRVQSIVVEFILTHVPQLFPEQGVSAERRKSLPSPSAINQDEGFFKCASPQPVHHYGNISPGDGPLAIRPYHAIIEGTDKRKGSLKGKKWMSFFNISGRFHDPRRRHKHSAKEKERPALRPARSMDSLSTPPYPNEAVRRTPQRPPSTNMSPLVTTAPQPAPEVTASPGPIGGSEYAVTYRRGTGLVSGGGGTQGTYTPLDPEGLGVTGSDTVQSRSPGVSTKVGRRAAMHITGPTMVTVPLHITSNLALGMLQGGGSDRVIHRGRDKEGGDRVEGKERGEKAVRTESRGTEWKVEESRKAEEKNHKEEVTEVDAEGRTEAGGGGEEESEGKEEEKKEEEEVIEECSLKPEAVTDVLREQRTKSQTSSTAAEDDHDIDEYMEMKGVSPAVCQPELTQRTEDSAFDAPDVLNSTQVDEDEDEQELSGYVQDNFEFLDQMDCSVMDHMDCRSSYQVTEFSVEPPGHSDDEYEVMEHAQSAQSAHHPATEPQTVPQTDPDTQTQSGTELKPHRPLSLDSHSRHTKSLSLPYMTSPVHGPQDFSSDEEAAPDDSDDNDYSSEDDDSMFIKSLPADFFLNDPAFSPDFYKQDDFTLDGVPALQTQSSEDGGRQTASQEFSACKDVDVEQVEGIDKSDADGLEEKEITEMEEDDHHGGDQLENNRQREETEDELMEDLQSDKEQPPTPEASTHCWVDFPPPSDDESPAEADMKAEEEADMFDNHHSDYPPCAEVSCAVQKDTDDVSLREFRDFSVDAAEQLRSSETEERGSDEGEAYREIEDMFQGLFLEVTEGDEDMQDEGKEDGPEVTAAETQEEELQGGDVEQESAVWAELEDVVCEVIEDEESKQEKDAGEREEDVIKDGEEEEEEGEKSVEVDREETNKSTETTEEKLQREFEEKQTILPKTNELEEAVQVKPAISDEAQHQDRDEEREKENKERADEQRRATPSAEKQLEEVRCDVKESRKCVDSEGGVGRKLVVSKHPRVYQVKAVPVVPPKPQHCKITALTLRQQQQERERRDVDRGRENTQDRAAAGHGEDADGREKRRGERAERERRRDGEESAARDSNRNSPLSMCFDEAVAIATMRREKEKECEKEKERQRDWGNEVQ